MAILFEDDARRAVQGAPTSLTISVPSITGSKGLIEVAVVFRNGFDPATVTCTWKGDQLTAQSQANGQGGELRTYIFAVSLGDGELGDGDVVVTPGTGDNSTALAARVTIYDQIDQANAIRLGTNIGTAPGSTANNVALTMNNLVAGDICVSVCHTGGSGNSIAPNQPAVVVWDPTGGGFIDSASGGVSRITATGTSQQMRWAWSFPEERALAVIAWAGDTSTTPVVTSVTGSRGAGKSVPPDDTNIAVLATDADVAGTTKLYLANDTDFGTATLEAQTFDGLTGTGLNWLAVNLGVFEEGPLFLFVVTDEGGGGESISTAFPVIISAGEVLVAGRLITLSGSESGLTTIVNDLEFVPHGAWIRMNGATSRGSFNPQSVNSICSVDDDRSMGSCSASSGTVEKRQQAVDSNTLILLDPTTAGAVEEVLGTPFLTDNGLDINFSASKQDIELLIGFFGGSTFQSKIVEATAADGVITGVPFQPDFGIFFSCNLAQGVAGDTAFSRMSLGVAKGSAAADQLNITGDNDGSLRNTMLSDGAIIRQISGTTINYTLVHTGFTADGMTWSGGGGELDSFFAHLFNLDGAGSYVELWQKESTGVDGLEELLPDSGLDDLRFLFQFSASRTDTDSSPAIGYRWDTGVAGNIAEHSELNVHNPAAGTGVAEQKLTLGTWAEGTDSSSVITYEGQITVFGRQSTVRWNINPPEAINLGLWGWETLGDDKFIVGLVDDSGLGFVGTVGTPQVTTGPVTVTADVPNPFVGFVPVPALMFGTPKDIEQPDAQTFVGIVPIHRVNVADDYTIEPDEPTFVGTVPSPTIPVPGPVTIDGALPSFVGFVPSVSLAFSVHQVQPDPPGFVGVVSEPSLAMTIVQSPVTFVGTVSSQTVQSGPRTIGQNPVGFVGVVSEGALLAGVAPTITLDPVTFVGTVSSPSLVQLLEQQPVPFVGTVSTPTVTAGTAPTIQPEPPGFVGVVPEPAVNMVIAPAAMGFVGVVPAPFSVTLRDPPGRIHMSLGLGA